MSAMAARTNASLPSIGIDYVASIPLTVHVASTVGSSAKNRAAMPLG